MKKSISKQLTVMFVGILIFVMAAMLIVNNIYLERFYELELQSTLKKAYEMIDANIDADQGVNDDYFEGEFSEYERTNNITMVVLDSDFDMILGDEEDVEERVMSGRLYAYSLGFDNEDASILKTTDDYTIQKKTDGHLQMEYLELWGILKTSSYHILMRIPIEAIRVSAKISGKFILYTILAAIVLSVIIIMYMSRRITKPIRELTELSKRMADLDFDVKYTSTGEDEIGQLGEHFNQMSETLEKTISELKTANNELQKNLDEKTRIDDMRREFLSNVSHELKTPLALIQGYAEGLQDSVADDPESRDYYCEVIVDEAEKMNKLVQKLLTLNQLEFGADTVEMVRFDLTDLIRGKVTSTNMLAAQKNAVITYEGGDSLQVWGDEFKVEEVLTNYLSNAINHVGDDGTDVETQGRIVVRTERIESSEGEKPRIRTTVFNSGSHIPEEDLDMVWDKFFKVDKARTRAYGGSGVGLSIVRAIMESFHQQYGVRNVEGGVEFWFELESAQTDEAAEAAEGAAEAAEKKSLFRSREREEDVVVDAEWTTVEKAKKEGTK